MPPPPNVVERRRQRNVRLILSYDGSDFCGWQSQPSRRSAAGVLLDALERLHRHPVRLVSAGRTDAGVHAHGQVVNFMSDHPTIPSTKFREAVNGFLPSDIRVLKSEVVDSSFNARRDAVRRIYSYFLIKAAVVPPYWRNYCHNYRSPLMVADLNRCAAPLVGRHDFSAFAAVRHAGTSAVRTVYSASFFFRTPFVVFRISANGFLWKMVRTIVGTITGLPACTPRDIAALLQTPIRTARCVTAPAAGLFLERVVYE